MLSYAKRKDNHFAADPASYTRYACSLRSPKRDLDFHWRESWKLTLEAQTFISLSFRSTKIGPQHHARPHARPTRRCFFATCRLRLTQRQCLHPSYGQVSELGPRCGRSTGLQSASRYHCKC